MTRLRCLFALVALLGVLLAGTQPVWAQHTRTVSRTVPVNAKGKVELTTGAGRVTVTTWDRPTVDLSARVVGADSAAVAGTRVRVEGGSHRVSLVTEGPAAEGGGLFAMMGLGEAPAAEVHYTLQVPATAALSVITQSAVVEVTGLQGSLTVEGSSSPVRLRDLGGSVTVATFSGGLDAERVRGPITFATFSGDVRVRMPAAVAECVFATFSGSAELILPSTAAFDLRTDFTWGGGVTSDFDLSAASDEGTTAVGGGGPKIVFESFSGDLLLRAE